MLVFVDYEHAGQYERSHGQKVLAARTTITYRLEDLAGVPCHLVRYDRVDRTLLDALGASAIFISGNSTTPERYAADDVAAMHEIIREAELPMFGFCGGFQLIAEALGAPVVPLADDTSVADDDPTVRRTDDGRRFEFGYHPVEVNDAGLGHPLLEGLREPPVFRHAHGLHVPDLPDGFVNLASTRATPHQLAVHDERTIVGTQFHPEYWTDEHPAGRTLIANFLRWSGVAPPVARGV